ncbi:unnamed protein product, partial [Prorocentrum cordatum]
CAGVASERRSLVYAMLLSCYNFGGDRRRPQRGARARGPRPRRRRELGGAA